MSFGGCLFFLTFKKTTTMKRFLLITALSLLVFSGQAQTTNYYKGEWRVAHKMDLFTCICKVDIAKDYTVKAEFAWVFNAIDTADETMMELYKGKEGKTGIEFAEGAYNSSTGDIYLEAVELNDPNMILGKTRYQLKLSADKQVIYGDTEALEEGQGDAGTFYAIKMRDGNGKKEFLALQKSVKL
jgi:hypothetical protein